MRYAYPAELESYGENEVVVSFRDIPWCHTSGEDIAEALVEAADALEEAIAWYIAEGEDIPTPSVPMPSVPMPGEYVVPLPAQTAAKAVLAGIPL